MDGGLSRLKWMRRWGEWIVRGCEVGVIMAAGLLVFTAVVVATFVLYDLFVLDGRSETLKSIDSLNALQRDVEQVFAGVLLLLLGLELLRSLTSFFKGHRF